MNTIVMSSKTNKALKEEYHVFGGCDILMSSENNIISEVLSAKYDDNKKEVEVIFPNKNLNCELLKGTDLTLSYVIAEADSTNSFVERKIARTITGLEFSHEKGFISIDALGNQIYVYKYKELSIPDIKERDTNE